uniref:Uncharacterized protein n=1 Tax=Oncorhynchus mykiss TaxID=8022 RepID=A0A8C7W9D5_ONCMY
MFLQGSEMTTLDNVADWHNLILKWDRLNDEGSTIANKIVNLGLTMFCDVLLDNKWNWEESHANYQRLWNNQPNLD